MTAVCTNDRVSEDELAEILKITDSFGCTEVVPERLMDAAGAVGGCSPAYVFMFIEAMADAAVSQGMPRKQAYKFASQTVLGSAKMVLETGRHPGDLKDMVCSPAGTTIEGVRTLERAASAVPYSKRLPQLLRRVRSYNFRKQNSVRSAFTRTSRSFSISSLLSSADSPTATRSARQYLPFLFPSLWQNGSLYDLYHIFPRNQTELLCPVLLSFYFPKLQTAGSWENP